MIQLESYSCIHISGQRQTDLEKTTSLTSPVTIMVRVTHVLFVFLAVFEDLKASFS